MPLVIAAVAPHGFPLIPHVSETADGALAGRLLRNVAEHDEALWLHGGLAGLRVRFENRLTGLENAIAELFAGHEFRKRRAIDQVRLDVLDNDLL